MERANQIQKEKASTHKALEMYSDLAVRGLKIVETIWVAVFNNNPTLSDRAINFHRTAEIAI